MSAIKLVPICLCPNCGTAIKIPLKKIGQIIRSQRKTEPTQEFMKKISKRGVLTRKLNAKLKNKTMA